MAVAPDRFAFSTAVINLNSESTFFRHGFVRFCSLVCLTVVATVIPSLAIAEDQPEVESSLRKDIAFLASDDLQGRDVGSPGLQQAANYIAQSFARSGLQVDAMAGSPFQEFVVPVTVTMGSADNNSLRFESADDVPPEQSGRAPVVSIDAVLDRGFRPMAIGDSANVTGRVVFAGYGITAPEYEYDDYAKIDAKGRILLVMRKEPTVAADEKKFAGERNSKHAYFETKLANAAAHGAVGVLFINDIESIRNAKDRINKEIEAERSRLETIDATLAELPAEATKTRDSLENQKGLIAGIIVDLERSLVDADEGLMGATEAGERVMSKGMPVASISREVANQLLRAAGWESVFMAQKRIDLNLRPSSVELNHVAKLSTQFSPSTAKSSNVIGVLPGRGPLADQTVIIGAHYDHVGMGGYGSLAPGTVAIHNGADDNASGTSAMLAAAGKIVRALSSAASHRRVVFIAFTGEERGLLGSAYYVRHPRFPLANTVAMVNLDMVGRLRDDDLTVYGTGSANEMNMILESANRDVGLKLFKVASGYGPSDHQSFYIEKIPVLFFFTGLHNDYHRPSDDFDKINFTGLTRITDITSGVIIALATRPQRPVYAPTDRNVSIRWQASAYLGVQIQPDDDGNLIISGITPGASADVAGVQEGDQLLALGGLKIESVGEVLDTVRSREIGEEMTIQVRRGETEMTVTATLQRRPD